VEHDANSGEHRKAIDIRTAGWWTQVVDAFRTLHFGYFGGLPVKIIWCLAGLAPGTLAVTGFIIWWRRRLTAKQVRLPRCQPAIPVLERDSLTVAGQRALKLQESVSHWVGDDRI
jgi:uncharacterized iron-regulated membrane protein